MSHDTEPARFLIYYSHCGEEWEDVWSCACDSECPECGADIEPYDYEDLADLRARAQSLRLTMPERLRERLLAFWYGMWEFRSDVTRSFRADVMDYYDRGRELMHRLTLRRFDR